MGAKDGGVTVLGAGGVQSETHLPFAGLHQLLTSILQLAEGLPSRQRAALLAALGMSDADVPELFLVGLAPRELIGYTPERPPALLSVEHARCPDHTPP